MVKQLAKKIVENDMGIISEDRIVAVLPYQNLRRGIYEFDQDIEIDLKRL